MLIVGGCNVVALEGMFLVGCCSWLQSIFIFQPNALLEQS